MTRLLDARRALRVLLLAALGLTLGASSACAPQPPRPGLAQHGAATPAPVVPPPAEPVTYVELLTGGAGADEALPLIVAIHGLGDRPETFAALFDGFETKARVILPRATLPYGDGYAWFPYRTRDGDIVHIAEGVAVASDRVAATIEAVVRTRPTRGRAIVTGFSQGGMISFGVATRHPEIVESAFPVSGFLPEPLYPRARVAVPPILAFHGDTDPAVPLELDRAGIERLTAFGANARLVTFPGVGHAIPASVHAALFAAIDETLATN